MSRFGASIAAKLYFFAFLALLAVASLAIASIHFSRTTEDAARHLYGDSFLGVLNSTKLELLLANHRRIVESMPPEVDRDRLQVERDELEQIKQRLLVLIGDASSKKGDDPGSLEGRIADSLPALFEAADQVAFYANEFAQDKAVEEANGYAYIANGIERLIKDYRDLRLKDAQQAIAFVSTTVRSLAVWVLLSAFAAIVLIGPIGLASMHRMLSRLAGVTLAMTRLARHDTTTSIPSRNDRDEVGAMARAVEVFKDNAIQLIAREVELKHILDPVGDGSFVSQPPLGDGRLQALRVAECADR